MRLKEDTALSVQTVNSLPPPLSDDELAVRGLPLRAIFALEVLARCDGRLHLAAKTLGISKPALSTQLTRLETALGADVVKKAEIDGRRFELTDTGEMLTTALRAALPNLVSLTHSFNHPMIGSGGEQRRRDQKTQRPRRPAQQTKNTL